MTVDLIYKSYSSDFEFLKFSLRSVQRFATGFRRIVVIVPEGQTPPTGDAETVHFVREHGEPYLFQQNIKLHADMFTDAEFICHFDSDTIWTQPVTPQDLIVDNRRPIWLYTPYADITTGDGQTWKKPTAKVMRQPVEHEFMRRHPFVTPRWALEGFRKWMWLNHGMSLESYIMGQPGRSFSEFNAIGAWLWFFHRDKVEWRRPEDVPTFVHQSWSIGGINSDLRKHLEAALA